MIQLSSTPASNPSPDDEQLPSWGLHPTAMLSYTAALRERSRAMTQGNGVSPALSRRRTFTCLGAQPVIDKVDVHLYDFPDSSLPSKRRTARASGRLKCPFRGPNSPCKAEKWPFCGRFLYRISCLAWSDPLGYHGGTAEMRRALRKQWAAGHREQLLVDVPKASQPCALCASTRPCATRSVRSAGSCRSMYRRPESAPALVKAAR